MAEYFEKEQLKSMFEKNCAGECAICVYAKDYAVCTLFDELPTIPAIPLDSVEKLQKIEHLINDQLVKACGSIGTIKIREILGEEDKPCQMQ